MRETKILSSEEDAFGQKLWPAYHGEEVFEIVERDDGYIEAMRIKGYFADYEDWSQIEQEAMKCVKGRTLDIGCGAGRHSLYLQRKGYDVLGVDISPLAIEVCKLRGLKKYKIVSLENLEFEPNSLETIIMMGNNFGLLGSFDRAREHLERFGRMTSDDALLIASTRDPYITDNPAHLECHKLNKEKGRMAGQVRIRSRFRKHVGRWFDYLMVSKKEMEEILAGTGWKTSEFLDSEEPQYIAIIDKRS